MERPTSGPLVARLFHRVLAVVFLIAWLSLGAQVDLIAGSRGLSPVGPWLRGLDSAGTSFWTLPSIFLVWSSDTALHAGIAAGVVLALLALVGLAPRVCFGVSTALYLGYVVVCRTFLSFQWDNLLLECGLLATCLPRDRRAPLAHLAIRVLVFKLYFESGIAKWQSPLDDWHDGSAMTFYYETAPLPTRLAHFAHSLPVWFHHFEAWFTLFFELVIPFAVFTPWRRARLGAAVIFTGFQVVNIATANYGFFAYLALGLHVVLLDDATLARLRARLLRPFTHLRPWRARLRLFHLRARARLRSWGASAKLRVSPGLRRGLGVAGFSAYLWASIGDGVGAFLSRDLGGNMSPVVGELSRLRLVNTYHLFASITRERIEPQVEILVEGEWREQDLWHKPGDPTRAPDFVAPHQPRVDFQLWFYGLSVRRGVPAYVGALLDRVCQDPTVVAPLFRRALPASPQATRMAFYRYHFTSPEEQRATGAYWRRERLGSTTELRCDGQ